MNTSHNWRSNSSNILSTDFLRLVRKHLNPGGVHAYNATGHNTITGVAMAGAMIFPPAILLLPVLDYAAIGESYDLIIGIDGARVKNFLDYQDRTRDLLPGEMIYLSVIRDGKRVQLTMTVPPNLTQATK